MTAEAAIVFSGAALSRPSIPASSESHSVIIRIGGYIEQLPGEVLVQGVVSPAFTFRVEKGTPTIGVVSCQQYRVIKKVGNDIDWPVVMLDCADGSTLSLTGVDMAGIKEKKRGGNQ